MRNTLNGIDREGAVHPEKKDGKIDGFPEKICSRKQETAEKKRDTTEIEKRITEGRKEIAEIKKDNIKLLKMLFMLSKEEFYKHGKKLKMEMEKETNPKKQKN